MDSIAFIITEREGPLFSSGDLTVAGSAAMFAALVFAVATALLGKKGTSLKRSYVFWLLLLSGVAMIAIGIVAGTYGGGPMCEIGG